MATLHFICGLAAAGKTTLARALGGRCRRSFSSARLATRHSIAWGEQVIQLIGVAVLPCLLGNAEQR